MDRVIKFRAWDDDRKEINHKVLVGNLDADDKNYTANCILIDDEWVNFDEFSDIKLMQFTGLTDKNGVDIYEGDVVEWNNCNWTIRYMLDSDLTSAGYYCESTNGNTFYCFSKTMKPSKVIGNIHENKDLIEAGK